MVGIPPELVGYIVLAAICYYTIIEPLWHGLLFIWHSLPMIGHGIIHIFTFGIK